MDTYEARPEPERPAGILNSLRNMLATLVALAHTRLELFTTEIEEEIQHAAQILLWALVALFFASLSVLMIALTLLIIFWDTHRVLVASIITGAFIVFAVTTALIARRRIKSRPHFLSASIEELKRDRAALERFRQ